MLKVSSEWVPKLLIPVQKRWQLNLMKIRSSLCIHRLIKIYDFYFKGKMFLTLEYVISVVQLAL